MVCISYHCGHGMHFIPLRTWYAFHTTADMVCISYHCWHGMHFIPLQKWYDFTLCCHRNRRGKILMVSWLSRRVIIWYKFGGSSCYGNWVVYSFHFCNGMTSMYFHVYKKNNFVSLSNRLLYYYFGTIWKLNEKGNIRFNIIEFATCILELQRIKHFARFSEQFFGDVSLTSIERCCFQNFFKVSSVVSEMSEVQSSSVAHFAHLLLSFITITKEL